MHYMPQPHLCSLHNVSVYLPSLPSSLPHVFKHHHRLHACSHHPPHAAVLSARQGGVCAAGRSSSGIKRRAGGHGSGMCACLCVCVFVRECASVQVHVHGMYMSGQALMFRTLFRTFIELPNGGGLGVLLCCSNCRRR